MTRPCKVLLVLSCRSAWTLILSPTFWPFNLLITQSVPALAPFARRGFTIHASITCVRLYVCDRSLAAKRVPLAKEAILWQLGMELLTSLMTLV